MIEIKSLSLQLGSFSLKDISFTIGDKEYFIVLGPTGAGKTILLQCIAGLHRVKQGAVWVDGREITQLTPEERHVGYVPQDYVLFPFLNVLGNIVFGLKRGKYEKKNVEERVAALTRLLGISHLLNRDTRSLSGGEKQRVAIARALAPSPEILLLDEPLSSLDLQTAKHLRIELRRIHQELGITTVHVTHNQVEAEETADRVAILNLGRLEQVGKPDEVFFYPENEIVSDFIGGPNILECDHCRVLGEGLMEVSCNGLRIIVPHDGDPIQRVALFPKDIFISDTPPPGPPLNRYKGTITGVKNTGTTVRLEVKVGEHTLQAEMLNDVFEDMDLGVDREVFLKLKLRRIRVLEGNSH